VTALPDQIAGPVTVTEIADLTAWMRRLSEAGTSRADPADLVAFHHAKQALLARLQTQNPSGTGKDTK
jgi:hypothetical protein